MRRATKMAGLMALCAGVYWAYAASRPVPVQKDSGYYFRLKVETAYRGEPLTFDIVAGCNARITHWIDHDRTVEVGLVPFVYGLKMRDGKGVVVRVPRFCEGLRSGIRGIGDDLLPFLAMYDDADKPTSGWLYATDDAYKSPLAELTLPKSEPLPHFWFGMNNDKSSKCDGCEKKYYTTIDKIAQQKNNGLMWLQINIPTWHAGWRQKVFHYFQTIQIAPEVYPIQGDLTMNTILEKRSTPRDQLVAENLLLKPERLGFAYYEAPTVFPEQLPDADWNVPRNGEKPPTLGRDLKFTVNGEPVARREDQRPFWHTYFESDKYILNYHITELADIFGGL